VLCRHRIHVKCLLDSEYDRTLCAKGIPLNPSQKREVISLSFPSLSNAFTRIAPGHGRVHVLELPHVTTLMLSYQAVYTM
jgi:hypothetical protein